MREILFRGKAFNGEWEYGVPVFSGLNNELAYMKQMHSYDHQVIPETIGQYTGLTDKNGKKIFEGDIICAFMDYGPAGFVKRIVSVGWHNEYGYQWNYFDLDTIEVIGNIHDNPELLKGGADNENL